MTAEKEFWIAINAVRQRVHDVETSVEERATVMRETIKEAVQEAMPKALLTDKQHQWVELAIEREAQSIKLRQAIIDKTLTALITMALAGLATGLGLLLKDYAIAHGLWHS